jgi:hypothetical protein
MGGRARSLGLTVAMLGMLVGAACGSTLPADDQARLEANARGGSVLSAEGGAVGGARETVDIGADPASPTSEGAAASGGAAAGAAPAGDGARRATATGAAASGATRSSGGATSAGTAVGESAPGVTDSEIKLGLVYDVNQGATNAALGVAPAVGQINTRRAYDALIAEINRTGGVAGRKLRPVYFTFDSLSGKTTDTIYAEACASFTQDNRVFAVLGSGNDNFRACLTKAGIIQVGNGNGLADSETYKSFPFLVETGSPALDRLLRFKTDALRGAGFYGEGRDGPLPPTSPFRLGIVLYDDPVFQRGLAVLRKELQARGIAVHDAVAIKRAPSTAQLGDETAAIRAASLKFKEQNITHVEFLATNNAFLQWRFMQDSEKQLYRPRYGLTSIDGGQALATLLGNDAAAQLVNAVSVGWFPLFDVVASEYSGDRELPGLKRCKKVLSDAGETFGEGDPTRNKEAQAAATCDAFFYLQAALTAGGKQVTTQSWLAGVAKQDNLSSAATFVMKTTAERRDAMGAYKDVRWFSECSCFRYTSDIHPV